MKIKVIKIGGKLIENREVLARLCDGLAGISREEADCIVIAGMGGELVIHIMEEGRHVWDTVEQWVLSPHSELHKVREWLEKNDFVIVKEDMIFEEGKFYTVMDVRKADDQNEISREDDEHTAEKRYRYGSYLRNTKNPVFLDFLKDEEGKLLTLKGNLEKQAVQSERAKESLKEVEEKLSLNREVQHEM